MPHNSYIHGGVGNAAAWVNDYVPTQLDFQMIDQGIFQSINGDLGGAWAPANQIVIGGAGVDFTSGVTYESTATALFKGTVDLRGLTVFDATAGGSVEMFQQMDVYGGAGGQIQVHSAARIFMDAGSEFTLHKDSQITADCNMDFGNGVDARAVTFSAVTSVSFAGNTIFSGEVIQNPGTAMVLNGSLILNGLVQLGSTGNIAYRGLLNMPNADATRGVNDGDGVIVLSSSITADHNLTVTSTGASFGSRFRVYNQDPTWGLTIRQDNASILVTVKRTGSGNYPWVELENLGTPNSWRVIAGNPLP